MNFCQNDNSQKEREGGVICKHHTGHHCVHAHSCTRKDHTQKGQKENKKSKKDIMVMQKVLQRAEFQGCQFTSQIKLGKQEKINQKLLIILMERQKEIKQLKVKCSDLQVRLRKENQQKSDLQSQLLYYREQFNSLVQCSTVDVKNQIKKRLGQTAELNQKIKSIQSKNRDLQAQNKELRDKREQISHNYERLKLSYEKVIAKSQNIYEKVKDVQQEKQNITEDWENRWRQSRKNEEKSKIIISELKKNCKTLQQKNQSLSLELQDLKVQKKNNEKKYKNEAEINRIKMEELKRQIEVLRSETKERQREKTKIAQDLKQMREKHTFLEQELSHTRNLIEVNRTIKRTQQKQTKIREESGQKRRDLNEKQNLENMTLKGVPDEKVLRSQITMLRQEIQRLKSENSRNIEQVILKIGASEAFKRIVDEKNLIIKQLMRQKAQIRSTAILSSHLSQ